MTNVFLYFSLFTLLTLSIIPASRAEQEKYTFTVDWFTARKPLFEKHLLPLAQKADGVKYLELGLFEGRSFLWVLDNVIQSPLSRADGVDLFASSSVEEVFQKNLAISEHKTQTKIYKGSSQEVLRKLESEIYDFIYVDAGHTAYETINDLVESFRLLKEGGIILVDDYSFAKKELPAHLRPQLAIDSFLKIYQSKIELIDWDYKQSETKKSNKQTPWGLVIKKVKNPCSKFLVRFGPEGNIYNQCSYLNENTYFLWTDHGLYIDFKRQNLNSQDTKKIEKYLLNEETLPLFTHRTLPSSVKNILSRRAAKNL